MVAADADGFAIRDANGRLLARISHRGQQRADDNGLSAEEACDLARLIARLPMLARRPQY